MLKRHFMNRLKMCCRTLSLRFSSRSVMCNTEKHIIIIIMILILSLDLTRGQFTSLCASVCCNPPPMYVYDFIQFF